MEQLIAKYRFLLAKTRLDFYRFLFPTLSKKAQSWMILGGRGTGKTTLLLQFIKTNLDPEKSLYLSLDDLYFSTFGIYETAEKFYHDGGEYLALDEVHKYPDWQREVKNILDFLPELKLYLSGSSVLALRKSEADLSRRVLFYELPELSFREYLLLYKHIDLPVIQAEDIIKNHPRISSEYIEILDKPLMHLHSYMQSGIYPFFQNDEEEYAMRLQQLIKMVIDYDLPEATQITVGTTHQIKKLLYIISESVPFMPNISKLSEDLGTTRNRLIELLHLLEAANLSRNLWSETKGISLLNKPEKIYLRNTNFMYALNPQNTNRVNLRETIILMWFQNAGIPVTYAKKADFFVYHKWYLEIGGKNKKQKQIAGQENGFLVMDDLPVGFGNKIPLWLWGFLY